MLFCLLLPAHGVAAPGFYQDAKQGWFWYKDPPPEKREEKTEKKAARHLPSLDRYTVRQLWDMYPDDFQKLLNVIQKKAVQHPTEKNILEYLTMQDIARRKALAYTNATMYVTQKYGNLFNVGSVYPAAGPGVIARVTMQENEIRSTIAGAREDHALIFFVQPGCGFCEKQARILGYFVDRYGWPVKTVDIRKNVNAAARFNVTVTPTLLLVTRGQDRYMTVATGVIALSELERRLYRAIRILEGRTGQDNFLMYDFQKGSPLDPTSILNQDRPWEVRKTD